MKFKNVSGLEIEREIAFGNKIENGTDNATKSESGVSIKRETGIGVERVTEVGTAREIAFGNKIENGTDNATKSESGVSIKRETGIGVERVTEVGTASKIGMDIATVLCSCSSRCNCLGKRAGYALVLIGGIV